MEKPSLTATEIPIGLEHLTDIDFVRIKKISEHVDTFTSLYIPNRYVVENSRGEQIFVTIEQPNNHRSTVRGSARGYKFDMYDKLSRLAFRIERPEQESWSCCICCLKTCCFNEVTSIVESPVGTLAGVILSKPSFFLSNIAIRDGDGKERLLVRKNTWMSSFIAATVEFSVEPIARNGMIAAQITGHRSGNGIKADIFELKFLSELDVRMKASIIGATILLDFTDFEGGSYSTEKY